LAYNKRLKIFLILKIKWRRTSLSRTELEFRLRSFGPKHLIDQSEDFTN